MNLRPLTIVAAFLFITPAAQAGALEDLVAAIDKCAAIADDTARHACYDQLPALTKNITLAAPQTARAQPATPPSKESEESWFGISDWFGSGEDPVKTRTPQQFGSESLPPPPAVPGAAPPPEPLDHITASVSSVTYNPVGLFTVFLDNGQAWRQLERDTQARFSKDRKNQVTISRGPFGGYSLKIDDLVHTYGVKRIK